jgi:toxin YoeB
MHSFATSMHTRGSKKFEEDYAWFARCAPSILGKIKRLIADIQEHPRSGIGRPESLKYRKGEVWSRRINRQNRLVYHIGGELIAFASYRGHYDDH